MLSSKRLNQLLDAIPHGRLGLLGDLFLDRYLELDSHLTETSIETGLDAYQVVRIRNQPGALGTVINNLRALGVRHIVPLSVIGRDGLGHDLLAATQAVGCDTAHVVCSEQRMTPTYTKPLLSTPAGGRELNRFDIRSREPLPDALSQEVADRLESLFPSVDGWIVLDQVPDAEQGVVNSHVRERLHQLCDAYPQRLILVDSRTQLRQFTRQTIKANQAECLAAAGCGDDIGQAVRRLTEATGRPVFCTQGEDGILMAHGGDAIQSIPGVAVPPPIDIVGAGDAVTSALAAALLAGATHVEAAALGNLAAAATIQQLGTTGTASPTRIQAAWELFHQRQPKKSTES